MPSWEQMVQANARAVYAAAMRILGNQHDAEDVAQDVFCEAAKLIGSPRVDNWPGLLRRMATFRAIDRVRTRRATSPLHEADAMQLNESPSQIAETRELADRLRTAIARLPDQQAAVLTLTYFESLDRSEIAACLEISPAAVSSALYKAHLKLKTLFFAAEANDDRA